MTVDPIPSLRPGRPPWHTLRAIAIATVVAIAIAACSSDSADEPAAAGTQGSTTSTTSTTAPSESGTTSVGDVPVTFTVPDGWSNIGWGLIKGDPAFGLIFAEVGSTYTDSCPSVPLDPPVGPTVEDLAAAWGDLPAFDATVPTDVTVDGFDGKLVEFTVPDYDEADCAYGEFMLLGSADDPTDGYWAQAPNQHHQLQIVDVDGTRVVIAASWYPDTSAEDRADIDEILSSIQIG